MITVFTSSFNSAEYLSKAIESVLGQTYTDFEYLLYDDGSTDASWEIMNSYKDARIKTFKLEKQKNVGAVINKSFHEAKGDYWCWCPADDFFAPQLLEKAVDYGKDYPKSVLYNNAILIDKKGVVLEPRVAEKMTAAEFAEIVWESCPIGFSGIVIPDYVYRSLPFPEHLSFSEDFYWMIKATILGIPFNGMPEFLSYKRKHKHSLTDRNYEAIFEQIPKIREELMAYKLGL